MLIAEFSLKFLILFFRLQGFNGRGGRSRGGYASAFTGIPRQPYKPNTAAPRPPNRNFNNNNGFKPPFNPRMQNFKSNLPPLRTIAPPPMPGYQPYTAPVTNSAYQPYTATTTSVPPTTTIAPKTQSAGLLPSQCTKPGVLISEQKAPPPSQYRDIKTVPEQSVNPVPRPVIVYDQEETFNGDPKTETTKHINNNVHHINQNYTNNNHISSNGKTELLNRSSRTNSFNSKSTYVPKPSVQGRLEVARQSSTENNKQYEKKVPTREVHS